MKITKFGQEVRQARGQVKKTLMAMANDLGTSPAFLSAMETGRNKIPAPWVEKIDNYFKDLGVPIENLSKYADAANENVSISGLPLQHQLLVSGFAKSDFSQEDLQRIREFFENLYANK
ncbi:helix-turn-helix domain-containing protein [Aquitalea magnusonii]|uniref:helix-turn-helix domain-containing protein n=1 Tax=Aquitalea magnusonii TaxID=332411 RepID=UPI000B5C4F7B|nr:helix-turn-helix transcriptional regulator [Aquitalea magnusonii]